MGKKVILFMDNAPVHSKKLNLSNVRIEFFPKNTTPVLQPLDRGIISVIKRKYSEYLMKRFLLDYEAEQESTINLLDATRWLNSIWLNLHQSVITNSFKSAGFIADNNTTHSMITTENEQLVLKKEALFDTLKAKTLIHISESVKREMFAMLNDFNNESMKKYEYMDEEKTITPYILNTNRLSTLRHSTEGGNEEHYLDLKGYACNKNTILRKLGDLALSLGLFCDDLPKDLKVALVKMENFVLKKEKVKMVQLTYNESLRIANEKKSNTNN